MKALWPELLVLVLFLTGDIFFSGMDAAAAGVAAGVAAYVILLCTGKKKPGLLMEGLVFGAITALGTFVQFPGGSLILMELVLGLILLVSVPAGWNLLAKMAGGAGRGLFSSKQAGIMSLAMGGTFTAHALLYAGLHLAGHGSVWAGAVLFAVLYISSLRLSAGRMKTSRAEDGPVVTDSAGGLLNISFQSTLLGTFRLGNGSIAEISEISLETQEHVFLRNLEIYLKSRGFRSVSISQWPEDEIELQMRGYSLLAAKWRKAL